MAHKDIGKKALALHKKLNGKISTKLNKEVRTRADLSLVYTPGVAAVSSHLAKHPTDARDYTIKGRTVAVISDGSAVLGLGNIGPYGALPVMEGKAALFKTFANVDAFPIVLDTQDVDEVVEVVARIAPAFGGINLEDFAAPNCFEIERRLKERLDITVMHDDQHGTAIVATAALLNAAKVANKKFETLKVVISGAGAAGTAIAKLLVLAGIKDIVVLDSKGIIEKSRKDLTPHKLELSLLTNQSSKKGGITEALKGSDAFIGVSGPGLLKAADIKTMAPRAIVFALANPTPEIFPQEAKKGGALVVGTGRSDYPNQINNSLAFPGVFRGALDNRVSKITDEMKLLAAHNLAGLIKKPTANRIVPGPFEKGVATTVARAIKPAK